LRGSSSSSIGDRRKAQGYASLNTRIAKVLVQLRGYVDLARASTQGSHSEGDHCSLLLSGPPAAHTQSLSAARRSAL
jgi:hypothetical protein